MTEKTYTIQTLENLLDVARETDDIDGLFEDLRAWVDIVLAVPDPGEGMLKWKPWFTWKDDGVRGPTSVRIDLKGER